MSSDKLKDLVKENQPRCWAVETENDEQHKKREAHRSRADRSIIDEGTLRIGSSYSIARTISDGNQKIFRRRVITDTARSMDGKCLGIPGFYRFWRSHLRAHAEKICNHGDGIEKSAYR